MSTGVDFQQVDEVNSMNISCEYFGYTLGILIADSGMSQREFARRIGCTDVALSRLCTGKTKQPNLVTAKGIADVCGVSLDELWSRYVSDCSCKGYAKWESLHVRRAEGGGVGA